MAKKNGIIHVHNIVGDSHCYFLLDFRDVFLVDCGNVGDNYYCGL
ncbi:MAG: hypothetical protein ABH851_03945 [Methanobacteriota archaeon]